jgi:hypothetical protein
MICFSNKFIFNSNQFYLWDQQYVDYEVDFLNWPNPSGRTGPGVDSASNRNEYQESLKKK